MSGPTIVLWRHGQTDFNAAGRLQGQSDIELNETGERQAVEAAPHIARLSPTRIISSPLQRAMRTAEVLADLSGLPVEPDERLQERSFGLWEGLTQEEIEEGWPAAFRAWRQGEEPEGIGADTRREVGERVAASLREAAAGLDEDGVLARQQEIVRYLETIDHKIGIYQTMVEELDGELASTGVDRSAD